MDALFGISAATAGDVNGDGYSDGIVGAPYYDNYPGSEGRAYVYLGSASGLATSPAWTAESDQVSQFGVSVATSGDVNCDGYSDVIVGAWRYSNGQSIEGRAYVYLGSTSGLATMPSWTAESDQGSAKFGISVATAGDVNGDGYSDVTVGAAYYDSQPGVGLAYFYLGSASGLATTPAWTAESDQVNTHFGISVATAGDVNGDGYSDVIVGADRYDDGQTDEGRAFLYYGNDGDGLDRTPRQARSDDAAPIDLLCRSDSQTSFRIHALGRTPAGRAPVRLEWEVEPLGTPFDGAGLQRGAALDTGSPSAGVGSAAFLDELVTGLTLGTAYHWRLRIVSASPFFPWSPWLSLPYNSRTETDLRTPICIDLDGDGHGSPGDASCPAGGLADCDDSRDSVHPGAPEICDGLDNDCDGTIDNAPVPVGSPSLMAARSGPNVLLSWTAVAGATGYDVVRGALPTLQSTGGDFTSAVDLCAENDLAATSVLAAGTSATGDNLFFLVGAVNCGGNGTYDTGSPSQVGLRDAEINTAPPASQCQMSVPLRSSRLPSF